MMVVTIVGGILVVIVGYLLVTICKNWDMGWEKVALQRDASHAMALMKKNIRVASSASAAGSTLTLGGTQVFSLSGNTLQVDGTDIIDGVTSLSFTQSGNTIEIDMTVTGDVFSCTMKSTAYMRNAG